MAGPPRPTKFQVNPWIGFAHSESLFSHFLSGRVRHRESVLGEASVKRNRRVLVTGGAGFIGSSLVQRLLREGSRVKVLDVQRGPLEAVKDSNLEFVGLNNDSLNGGMVDKYPDVPCKMWTSFTIWR